MVSTSIIPNRQNYIDCGCGGCGGIGLMFANLLQKASKMLLLRQHLASKTINTAMLASTLNSGENTLLGLSQETGATTQMSQAEEAYTPYADTIYHNGPILTMVQDGDYAEALAVKNGEIFRIGKKEFVFESQGPETRVVDLQQNCLMPGFIDPHSHLVAQSFKFNTVNLDPKPIGNIGSIEDIKKALQEEIIHNPPQDDLWLVGWGYDDTAIAEMRHPNKTDLDLVSTDIPIALVHISGHLIAVNSKVLELLKINSSTPDPDGGRYHRVPGTKTGEPGNHGEPSGVAEENAMFNIFYQIPQPSGDSVEFLFNLVSEGLKRYMEAGITTTTEGFASKDSVDILKGMAQAGKLPIDVVCYPSYREMILDSTRKVFDPLFDELKHSWKTYSNHLRLGGLKMTLDGSIQGYTAFLSQPYHVPPSETGEGSENLTTIIQDKCQTQKSEQLFIRSAKTSFNPLPKVTLSADENHDGYGSLNMDLEEVKGWVQRCDDNNVPFLAHTNGDAATDVLIDAIRSVRQTPRQDLRSVIIHAQTIRDDQLNFAAEQGMIPSLFPTHIPYWGDRHRDIFLGPERAARICPAQSCVQRGIKFTLHHDAPIAGVGMLPLVWAAVNRKTSGGHILGENQKITPFEALCAITADAAFQYFEEDRKGTLEVGKLADLVILAQDPLSVEPLSIKDITVLETIKEGVTVYHKSDIG